MTIFHFSNYFQDFSGVSGEQPGVEVFEARFVSHHKQAIFWAGKSLVGFGWYFLWWGDFKRFFWNDTHPPKNALLLSSWWFQIGSFPQVGVHSKNLSRGNPSNIIPYILASNWIPRQMGILMTPVLSNRNQPTIFLWWLRYIGDAWKSPYFVNPTLHLMAHGVWLDHVSFSEGCIFIHPSQATMNWM